MCASWVRADDKVVVMFVLTTCRTVRTFTDIPTMKNMTSGKYSMNPPKIESKTRGIGETVLAKELPINDVRGRPLTGFCNPPTKRPVMGMASQ